MSAIGARDGAGIAKKIGAGGAASLAASGDPASVADISQHLFSGGMGAAASCPLALPGSLREGGRPSACDDLLAPGGSHWPAPSAPATVPSAISSARDNRKAIEARVNLSMALIIITPFTACSFHVVRAISLRTARWIAALVRPWPDLVIGAVIAIVVVMGGVEKLVDARRSAEGENK